MQLLFCEDEYLTRIGVMQTIPWEEIGITHVDCAKNGQEGMEMLSTHPDILLTDIRMPFVSGLDIASRLKEMDPYSEVIIMSSYSDKEYLKKAITLSTVAYIEKPLDLQELRSALESAVARRRQNLRVQAWEAQQSPAEHFACLPDPDSPAFSQATRIVLREIRDRYADLNLSVDALAESVHFSPVYLGATFREETGIHIRSLITSVRIEAACRLLRETNLPITEVARKSGFNSANYFAKQFRAIQHMQPNEYRNGRRRKEGDV